MRIQQSVWQDAGPWLAQKTHSEINPQLILVFGGAFQFKNPVWLDSLKSLHPHALLIGCSTAGEIIGTRVLDDSVVATAIEFEKTAIEFVSIAVDSPEKSEQAAEALMAQLNPQGLRHVIVLSEGLNVNGSQLVKGLRKGLPEGVSVTGGLAGDGADFQSTFILSGNVGIRSNRVAAIGFYGNNLEFSYGSFGGWDSFGIDRRVTKSQNNILYEIDGQPALQLYKSFLGEQASQLPASGLLFPLSLRTAVDEQPVVRTILAINEEEQSITFAGDLPEGSFVRLMKANTDRLIHGAVRAAELIKKTESATEGLAILISCVGRKLVLKQMVEEEVEGVHETLGEKFAITGFYSYGEISPFSENASCELHNQTMTITTLREI